MGVKFLNLSNLKGDLSGGLTAGVVALPLSLAFGIASGLGAAAGLYGAILLSFFASIFGGTKTQISGPTGPMSVVIATAVLVLEQNLALIVAVFVLAGAFQVLFGILRVGKFVKFIPYPVISGFMSGVGIIIILLQIAPFLGQEAHKNTIVAILSFVQDISNFNTSSFMIGSSALAMIYLTPKKITSYIPSPLLALIVLSLIVYIFKIDVKLIGEIPTGLPHFIMPNFTDFSKVSIIVSYAAMLALLGSIDSLLTSLVADSVTKTKHNSNKELIGQGIGNMIAGLFGGIVGAGATMRTIINVKTGGNTRLSGVISSIFLLLVLLSFGSLVSNIPIAALSGILIKVGIDILDYRLLKRLKNAPLHDLLVMFLVFFLTVFVDLIFAVGVGVVASSLLLVYRISQESDVEIVDEGTDELNRVKNGIRIVTINGAFFFGSTAQILERTSSALELNFLIIDCSKVPFIDLSAAYALEEMINAQQSLDTIVYLVLSPKQIKDKSIFEVKKLIGQENIFTDRKKALFSAAQKNKALNY